MVIVVVVVVIGFLECCGYTDVEVEGDGVVVVSREEIVDSIIINNS